MVPETIRFEWKDDDRVRVKLCYALLTDCPKPQHFAETANSYICAKFQ